MNVALISPKAREVLEEGCYLMKDMAWYELSETINTLDGLCQLAHFNRDNDVTLSVDAFIGIMRTLAGRLEKVENELVHQNACKSCDEIAA
jgi:hypothetical protein